MRVLRKIDYWVMKIQEFTISSSIIMMSLILIGNVVSRKFFGRSWEFAEELGQMLVVIITFIGTSYAVRKGKHIRMSAVFDAMSLRIQKIFAIVITTTSALSMVFLLHLSIKYFVDVLESGRVTPVLKIPITFTVSFVCVGFFLSAVHFFTILILNIKNKEVYLSTEEFEVNG